MPCAQAANADLQERQAGGGGFHILCVVGVIRDSPHVKVLLWERIDWMKCYCFTGTL